MENLEVYALTSDKLDVSNWKRIWSNYMFPQNDGTLQFGMGVDALYCLGAYSAPEQLVNKVLSMDMSLILRPSVNLLFRAPMENSGLGPGQPCYLLYFYDDGTNVTVKLSRYNNSGAEEVALSQPIVLNELIDLWDYNHYEIAMLNEGEDVRILISINGQLVVDCVDEAPGETYMKAGNFVIQGGHSVVRLRGTDSDVPSTIAKPVKTGEVNGVGMYDVSAVESIDTRVMSTITTPRVFTAANGFKVNYRIYLPANYDASKEYPLHLHLHGGGLRGNDNLTQIMGDFNQLNMLVQHQKKEEFIFIVPECPVDRFWSDSMIYNAAEAKYYVKISETPESVLTKALIELVDSLSDEFSVNEKRLYLSGASMGGMGSYDIAARYPEKFAAAFIGCAASDVTVAEALSKTPLYIVHGDADVTVQVEGSRNMDAAFKAMNSDNYVYVEFPGRGHDFSTVADLAVAMDWLYSKTR